MYVRTSVNMFIVSLLNRYSMCRLVFAILFLLEIVSINHVIRRISKYLYNSFLLLSESSKDKLELKMEVQFYCASDILLYGVVLDTTIGI